MKDKEFEINIYNFSNYLMFSKIIKVKNLCSASISAAGLLATEFDEYQKANIQKLIIREIN